MSLCKRIEFKNTNLHPNNLNEQKGFIRNSKKQQNNRYLALEKSNS
jgi:hypothetical protein